MTFIIMQQQQEGKKSKWINSDHKIDGVCSFQLIQFGKVLTAI